MDDERRGLGRTDGMGGLSRARDAGCWIRDAGWVVWFGGVWLRAVGRNVVVVRGAGGGECRRSQSQGVRAARSGGCLGWAWCHRSVEKHADDVLLSKPTPTQHPPYPSACHPMCLPYDVPCRPARFPNPGPCSVTRSTSPSSSSAPRSSPTSTSASASRVVVTSRSCTLSARPSPRALLRE